MPNKKWLAPILPYLAVWAGLFLFKSAWLTLIGFHAAILLVLTVVRPSLPINILFKSKSPKWILISALVGSTSGMGLYFLWDVFGITHDLPAQLESIGLNSSSWFAFIAYFSLINPWLEEYFWRGVLGSRTKKVTVIDVVYAGYHALVLWGRALPLSMLLAVIILTSAGWLWRQISREDDGLLAAVLGHAVADFSILMVLHWMCI
ncbi:MAG: CPBP family glutamic-type intramembrane protease [Anaerolineales bacterium]|nr:CPBP family glutamic-type intramembrane protease [Anaerolineales bacterium]